MNSNQYGENVIRGMCKVTESILDYRYATENYKGDSAGVLEDKKNTICNKLAVLTSDINLYANEMGFAARMHDKAEDRRIRMAEKMKPSK